MGKKYSRTRLAIILALVFLLLFSCTTDKFPVSPDNGPFIVVLGTSQDGGYPQAGCTGDCCRAAWEDPGARRLVASLAIVDPVSGEQWLIDATPDFREQLHILGQITGREGSRSISGIILTHAHAGHYTGLIHLGREVMGSRRIPVYAMPRMQEFLEQNAPWEQLVKLGNIDIKPLQNDSVIRLNDHISIVPLLVPHRDEYSETIGVMIEGPGRKILYIPDIDKWDRWEQDINELIRQVDIAFLDGTFFRNGELPGRNMDEITHPFIEESMNHFKALAVEEKARVHFIHFNHTNPVIRPGHNAREVITGAGYRVATERQIVSLTGQEGNKSTKSQGFFP